MASARQEIAAALAGWLAAGCRRACPGWGPAPAEAEATVSGSTRLVLAIAGRNHMRLPQGEGVAQVVLRAGEAALVHRLAWNRPLHLAAFAFLTIDLLPGRLRLFLRRRQGPGRDPADSWQLLLQGGADAALRAAADAAEALAPDGGTDLARAAWLMAACTRRLLGRPEEADDPAWQRLREWIEEHLHEPDLGRTAAARACGMHPGHASRVLARAAGCGFAGWVARRRCERARDLLAGSRLEVAEVGRRCGFASPAYFNHAFRAACGTSPGRWRAAFSA